MRDRLVELINEAKDKYPTIPSVNCCKPTFAYYLADLLLADGFIRPPCKVGDTVWFVRDGKRDGKIEETTVEKIVLKGKGIYIKLACDAMYETSCNSIGKTVFLAREEAKQALKGEHHAEIH